MKYLTQITLTVVLIFPSLLFAGPLHDQLNAYLSEKESSKKETYKELLKEATYYYCLGRNSTYNVIDLFKEWTAAQDLMEIDDIKNVNKDDLKRREAELRTEYYNFRACREEIWDRYNKIVLSGAGKATPASPDCKVSYTMTCSGKEYLIKP